MTIKPKHGGARKGAGRKSADGIQGKARLVRLDDKTVEVMQEIGNGNLSLGIRLAASLLRK